VCVSSSPRPDVSDLPRDPLRERGHEQTRPRVEQVVVPVATTESITAGPHVSARIFAQRARSAVAAHRRVAGRRDRPLDRDVQWALHAQAQRRVLAGDAEVARGEPATRELDAVGSAEEHQLTAPACAKGQPSDRATLGG
jgi:hypothetical protein